MFILIKICLTGGPCSGKTDILEALSKAIKEAGYYVFIIPETASELILNGIKVNSCLSPIAFQGFVLDKQIAKEKLYANLSKYYDNDKIVILCDRGILDGFVYVGEKAFEKLLKERNFDMNKAYSQYDAVFHLVTTADGAEEFYQWNSQPPERSCNNPARSETPEEAFIKDRETLEVWSKHPYFRVFDNSTDFKGKIKRVVDEALILIKEKKNA